MPKQSAAPSPVVTGRYDRYTEKILSLRRVMDTIIRYRVLLILVAALIVGSIVSLLAVIGHFTVMPVSCTCHYGEVPAFSADAFWSQISYEYATEDGSWHTDLPQIPGNYRVRALSKNGFGKIRHSKEADLTILPRSLSVTLGEEKVPYGNSLEEAAMDATAITGLADGDRVADLAHTFDKRTKTSYAVTLSGLQIRNSAGQDVTACYAFTLPEATFTVIPRPVTIQVENGNKLYDGQPWVDEEIRLAEGSLVAGHRLEYDFPQRPTATGEYSMLPNCRITDENGMDVTENYSLSVLPGNLKILPRPLSLSSASDQKIYDGTPLVNNQWELIDGSVAPLQQLLVEVTGILTDAGKADNAATVCILNDQGEDVTENYDLSVMLGTLTVLPRPLSLRSEDDEKVYDGTPLVNSHWEITGGTVAPGQQLFAEALGSLTDAGTAENTLCIQIQDAQGRDVAGNYDLSVLQGTLKVLPRPLTLVSASDEKIYDGTPLVNSHWEITDGSLAPQQQLLVEVIGSLTDAGMTENTLHAAICDADGQSVTKNYSLTIQNGNLTVHKRPVTLSTGSAQKVYDDTPLTCPGCQFVEGSAAPNQTINVRVTGSQTIAGTSKNTLVPAVLANSKDVTHNYDFTLQLGDLTVTPITLVFHNESAEKVYDGKPLTTFPKLISGAVVPGHRLGFAGVSQIEVGSKENSFSVGVYSSDGRDVTDEGYIIEITYGTLTVTPRPITISTCDAKKIFDGLPLTCHEYTITHGSLAEGHTLTPHFTGSQTQVGSSKNTMTASIQAMHHQDRTDCYDITYEYGTLTVLENPDLPGGGDGEGTGEGDGEGTGEGGGGGTGEGEGGGTGEGEGSGTGEGGGGSTGEGEGTGEGGGHDPNAGTEIGFPDSGSGSGAPVAHVTGKGPGYQQTPVYFREMNYGNYTGTGWTPANKYSGNPYAYLYQALLEAGVDDPDVEIQRLQGCPTLVPYFGSMTDWGNDCYVENDCPMTYSVSTCVDWNYWSLKNLRTPSQYAAEEAAYRAFVYENYLQIPDSTKGILLAWAAEHGITDQSPYLVELIQIAIQHAGAYNMDADPYPKGADVAVHFLTVAKEGICQHFATTATLMYRAFGIPARYTVGYLGQVTSGVTTTLTSSEAHAWVEIYLDGLGWVPIEVTGSDSSGGGFTPGEKYSIQIHAASLTKYYDGKPFTAEDITKYAVVSGLLMKGHTLQVTIASENTGPEPGSWQSVPISYRVLNEHGIDVTQLLYDIQIQPGTLTILPRKITITTGSASKHYDGKPLRCDDYWISQGSLAPGETLQLILSAALTDPGEMINEPQNVTILRANADGTFTDTTHCYEITLICGILEVQQPIQPAALPPKKTACAINKGSMSIVGVEPK